MALFVGASEVPSGIVTGLADVIVRFLLIVDLSGFSTEGLWPFVNLWGIFSFLDRSLVDIFSIGECIIS